MFSFDFTNFNLTQEYQNLFDILIKHTTTLPTNIYAFNQLFNTIYYEMYPIMNNITNYYIYKDTLQDETTIFHEIFDKLFGVHNNCLCSYYTQMNSYIEVLSTKISLYAKEREKYGGLDTEVNKLFQDSLLNSANRILRVFREDLEKIIIMSYILKEKTDKEKSYNYN